MNVKYFHIFCISLFFYIVLNSLGGSLWKGFFSATPLDLNKDLSVKKQLWNISLESVCNPHSYLNFIEVIFFACVIYPHHRLFYLVLQQSSQSTLNDLLAWLKKAEGILSTMSEGTLNQGSLYSSLEQVKVKTHLLQGRLLIVKINLHNFSYQEFVFVWKSSNLCPTPLSPSVSGSVLPLLLIKTFTLSIRV